MECLALAASSYDLRVREANLRLSAKTTSAAVQVMEFRDRLGRRPEGVTVGEVNVEAGGQAIVGTVEVRERDEFGWCPQEQVDQSD